MQGVEKKHFTKVIILEIVTLLWSVTVIYIAYILSPSILKITLSLILIANAIFIGFLDFIITRIVNRDIYFDNSAFYHGIIYTPKFLSYFLGAVGIINLVIYLFTI